MTSRAWLGVACGMLALVAACGCKSENQAESPCSNHGGTCEASPSLGTTIGLGQGSARIAAIEMSGCNSSAWAYFEQTYAKTLGASRSDCGPSSSEDAGVSSCFRYACVAKDDAGLGCVQAWIDLGNGYGQGTCAISVMATTGERQNFAVLISPPLVPSYCRTSMGQCVVANPYTVTPPSVTLSFASLDAGTDAEDPDASDDVPGR